MFRLLRIFDQLWGEPWYGNNSCFLQGRTTGPHHIELAGSQLLSVPWPIAAQRERHAAFDVVDTPQRACCGQDHTQRVGADDALPLAALSVPQAIAGIRVTDGNFHRPAVGVLVQDCFGAQGQIGREKRLDRRRWLALPRLVGAMGGIAPYDHDPDEPPRQHRVPQPTPRLDLGARFAWGRGPALGGLGQGLGRAEQVAFFAWGAATLVAGLGRQRVELGADRKTPDPMRCIGQLTDVVLSGIATVSQAPDLPPGQLRGHKVEDTPGQLTAGTIRHVEFLGLRWLEIAFEAHRDAEAVARPPFEGNTHHAKHEVQAPQRAVCLAG